MWGPEDKNYLDHKAMYNEISLTRSRNRSQLNRTSTIATNPALALLQNTDKQAIVEAKMKAMNRAMSTTNYKEKEGVENDDNDDQQQEIAEKDEENEDGSIKENDESQEEEGEQDSPMDLELTPHEEQ